MRIADLGRGWRRVVDVQRMCGGVGAPIDDDRGSDGTEGESLIDQDIRKAATLPSRFYTDEELFEEIKERWKEHWHFAAHDSEFGGCAALPLPTLEAQTGEPMVLTSDDGVVRALSNVCTHRGMIVTDAPCEGKVLQCPYHGRTFGLDGGFRNMPMFDKVEGFPTEADNLRPFSHSSWNGFHFASVASASSFDEWFEPVARRMAWWPLRGTIERDPERDREWTIAANWALYVDNYLEGFHIPFVHGDLNEVLEPADYRTETIDGGVLQIGMARAGEACFDLPEGMAESGERVAAYYWWLFPGLMLNFYPWGLSVNLVVPEAVDRTRLVYRGYVSNPELLGSGAGGDLDKVELEDQMVVEACQRGVDSVAYDRGRYSPEMERGIHHFHQILNNREK